MKELNEDIKRLRQIMSYNRSKGLLVNESQYDLNEQEESNIITDKDLMGRTGVLANIGGLFNDDRGGVKGVVDSLDGFVSMDNLENVLATLEGLKGKVYKDETQDPPVMISAIKRFAELYKADENGDDLISDVESVGTRTLPATAETLKKKIVNLVKSGEGKVSQQNDSNLEDMPKIGDPGKGEQPGKGEEPGKGNPNNPEDDKEGLSDCPTIEDLKSGKKVLKAGGGNENCDVISLVQKRLMERMKASGLPVTDIEGDDLGNYGKKTASMVAAFQNFKGLKVDGVVGRDTMRELGL